MIKSTAVLLLLYTAVMPALHAQPVPDRILDTLDLQGHGQDVIVRVNLAIPVRYMSHFPAESGKELRIRLQPVSISPGDRDALYARETLVPGHQAQLFLNEVIYEGDMEGGPYLTLLFDRSVYFKVEQGRDSRSIVVRVTLPTPELTPPASDSVL
jgi:hypothetical protein